MALVAVGLPLLIHLLNLRRPQKVAFSTLAFFRDLKNTTIRRIRIKRYLLLLLRLLAIACLAMVLARPFLPPGLTGGGNSQAPALNAVLLDNSVSMSRIGTQGPLFEYAKEIAGRINEAAKDEDRYMLQLTNGEADYGNIMNWANMKKALEEAEVKSAGNFMENRLTGLLETIKEAPYANKSIYILTDAQHSQLAQAGSELDMEGVNLTVIDVGSAEVQNTSITSVSTSTNMIGVDIPFTLNVEIANQSEVAAVNQFVSLEFEGQAAGQYSVSLEPGERRTYAFEVTPSQVGSARAVVSIEGDGFQPDNQYFVSLQVPETRNVLWVSEQENRSGFISYTGAVLQAAGENDAQLDYDQTNIENFDVADLSAYDVVLLDGVKEIPEYIFSPLQEFVQTGGGVMFFPAEDGNLRNYNDFLGQFNAGRYVGLQGEYGSFNSVATADELLEDHPAFAGLFEREGEQQLRFTNPEIYYYYRLNTSSNGTGFSLLNMNNGDPLVYEKQVGQGTLVLSAAGNDPGWSNFPVKALYAPFYYRILLYSASSDQGGFADFTLGQPFAWTGNVDPESVVLQVDDDTIKPGTAVVSSGVRVSYPAEEWTPGWIKIQDDDGQVITLAANLSQEESVFTKAEQEEAENLLSNESLVWVDTADMNEEQLQNEIVASGFGREIWSWFMLAGLLFLITETLVSIGYRAETVE
ncbi:N-terminal double-transmembrane domain-containing protein [Gracilimonas mengyeensis]|uniref:N-terminal double-transmembrane domain-containing protein n=2 Tax=Gracilimonas mengyeensis TaxID=1302730 RepID=A0A521B4Z6_9BACT|nr:N-terminal double-transmembrane domain-containing protein [Gracilimonas mengyeensis]